MFPIATLLASCGGGDGTAAPPTPTTGLGSVLTTTPTASGSAAPTSKATSKSTRSATAKPTATSTGGGVARLDRACGRRGVDTQALNVRTQSKGPVGFNTQYSDGSSSTDGEHSYSGGYGGGFADDAGNYRNTWVIDPQAPLGIATVKVISAEGTVDLTYRVVAANGSC